MRRHLFPFLVAGVSALAASAHAADGAINSDGSIKGDTCTIAVNGIQAPAATVTLQTLPKNMLDAAGKTAGQTPFKISLTECTSKNSVAAFFKQDGFVDDTTGLLNNTGTAANVHLWLVDANNGNAIRAGDDIQKTASTHYAMPLGAAELLYAVRYYAIGVAGGGTVRGSITYELHYR